MCGIAGIIGPGSNNLDIRKMLNRISHRGPDGLFYWADEWVSFGHARLSIIDLSAQANQPMTDPETGNVIIFNGEIFNYIEIKKSLEGRYVFKTDSDTEVLLAAYSIYGLEFLTMLRGMFAMAIYNRKDKRVLLARDRFGIKPLYYRFKDGNFIFGSEVKSIINLNGKTEDINEHNVYRFLADCQLDCDEHTLFKDVSQVLPAHYCWVNSNGQLSTPVNYWPFPEPGKRKFNESAKEELIEKFDDTLKIHLRSDVPVGAFLSGGLDSTAITCFALRNLQQEKMHSFSAILPYYNAENILIKDIVAENNKLVSHEFSLEGERFFDDIPKVIFHNGEPTMDGSMYSHYKLCELAKQHGTKVLLSGSGGDELFGGYDSHVNAQNAKLLKSFQLGKYLKNISNICKKSSTSYNKLLLKSMYECIPVEIRRSIKNKQLKRNTGYLSIHPKVKHFYETHPGSYHANLLNNYKSWSAPPFLHYEDRNSMAFGIEIRVPFFDHELVEFILQFSSDDVISGSSKSLMRTSFKGILPDSVLQQKSKYGFPSPIDHTLKKNTEGRDIFYAFYKDTPLLNPEQAKKLADNFYNGNGEISAYWRMLSYIIWYRIYFKGWNNFIKSGD